MRKCLVIVLFFAVYALAAQINHPKASPAAKVEQEVGLSKIVIDYSRPAVRGRKIFGDLVPYGRIWRVGANASTKITVTSEVKIMGNILPAGTYALYAFPEAQKWQIVFHANTAHWGDGRKAYNPEEDVFRVTVIPETLPTKQENFLITFDEVRHDTVNMIWAWDTTRVVIPISVDTHSLMLKEIEIKLGDNPSAQTYYESARYLQEWGTDYRTALAYLNKAITLGGDTYYFYRVKSLVEAALKDYGAAITSAKKSLELASAQEKDEFVRMNQKNIDFWEAQLKLKN